MASHCCRPVQAFSTLVASAKAALLRSVHEPTLEVAAKVLCHFLTNASTSFSQLARSAVREAFSEVLRGVREAAAEADTAVSTARLVVSDCMQCIRGNMVYAIHHISLGRVLCFIQSVATL